MALNTEQEVGIGPVGDMLDTVVRSPAKLISLDELFGVKNDAENAYCASSLQSNESYRALDLGAADSTITLIY